MITELDGANGNPILLNVHLDINVKDTHFFPQTEPQNTDRFARNMFRISSPMPDWMVMNAKNHGFKLEFDSKALIMNAWPGLLSSFLSIGSAILTLYVDKWMDYHVCEKHLYGQPHSSIVLD